MSSSPESEILSFPLKYKSAEVEQVYAEATFEESKRMVHLSMLLAAGTFLAILGFDVLILGRWEWVVFLLVGILAPLTCLSFAAFVRFGKLRNRIQLDIVSITFSLSGQALQFTTAFLFPELGGQFLMGNVILTIMGYSGSNGTNYRRTIYMVLTILVAFALKVLLCDDSPTSDKVFQVVMGISVSSIGMSSGYLIEKAKRIDFLKNETLEQKQMQLVSKNKELEQFTYIASHDLQEPLRSITSFSHLLDEDFRDKIGDTGGQYLTFITEASTRMRNLIKGLLDYSRLGREANLKAIDANQTLRDIQSDLRVAISESGATVTSDPLPTIEGYETEFRQLLQNLLSNALKFRAPGVPPKVHVSAQRKGTFWEFSVSDNGIGIEKEHFDKIFLIFQRLHSRSSYEGTGIGLANCRKIVELHGGTISVTSEYGKGSTFYFTIPTK